MRDQFNRQSLLIGDRNTMKLLNSSVIIFGLGGVGGYVVEALARAGVGEITLVDFDIVDITNLNRQIIGTHSSIGQVKTELFKKRILDINPKASVKIFNKKATGENITIFFDKKKYDYIVDTIDAVFSKLALITISKEINTPIISSMGFGNKLDPSKIQVADISKTRDCPLARTMRKELKKRRIKKVKTVFSTEFTLKPKHFDNSIEVDTHVGSTSFLPGIAGLTIAGEVIKDLIKEVEDTNI